MATVQDMIDQLPLHFSQRYGDAFWIKKMNLVLGDLEVITTHSDEIKETPIFLIENVTNYDIPSDLRDVIRVRTLVKDRVSTRRVGDAGTSPPYRIIDNKIRLTNLPEFSSNADITGTVAAIEANNTIVSGALRTGLTEADEILSRLITVTHAADSSLEYRIISSSDITSTSDTSGSVTGVTSQAIFEATGLIGAGDDKYNNFTVTVTFDATGLTETRTISDFTSSTGQVTVSAVFVGTLTTSDTFTINAGIALPNGIFDTTLVIGDTFSVTSNFYMVEGWRQKTKFTLVTDTLPIDPEFEDFFVNGLRYLGEIQTDLDTGTAGFWSDEYSKSKKKYRTFFGKPVGDQKQQFPDDGFESLQ